MKNKGAGGLVGLMSGDALRYSPPPASLPPSYVSFHNVVLLLDLFDRMFLSRAEGPEYGGVHFAELFLSRLSLNVCLRLDWDRFSFEFPPCCLPDRVLVVAFLAFEHMERGTDALRFASRSPHSRSRPI
jgi:hypothetical protein